MIQYSRQTKGNNVFISKTFYRFLAIALLVISALALSRPFWSGAALGLFLAMGTWGLRERAAKKGWGRFSSAFIATTMLALLVFVPLGWLTMLGIERISMLIEWASVTGKDWRAFSAFTKAWPWLADWANLSWKAVRADGFVGVLMQKMDKGMIASMAGSASVFMMSKVFDAFVALATFFWLWCDDSLFKAARKLVFWLGGKAGLEMKRIAFRVSKGMCLGFIVLGLLEGGAFALLLSWAEMPYARILGFAIGFMAAIPLVAPLMAGAVVLWLWFFVSPIWGVVMATISLAILFGVDPIARAKMAGKGAAGTAATLVGLLGGMATMGLPGFFAGPIVFAILAHAANKTARRQKI